MQIEVITTREILITSFDGQLSKTQLIAKVPNARVSAKLDNVSAGEFIIAER